MKGLTIGVLGAAALVLAGCETLNGPEAYANAAAQRQQCKAVVSTNTADSMRLANHQSVEQTDMKRAEATLATSHFKQVDPPAIKDDHPNEETLTAKTLRDC